MESDEPLSRMVDGGGLAPFDIKVSASGITSADSQHTGWQSPRLRQAMLQMGTKAEELYERDVKTFYDEAVRRGEQMGWRSQTVLNDVAKRRHRTAELQRRKVLKLVVDVRRGMVKKGTTLSPLVEPSQLMKASNIDNDEDVKAQLAKDAARRQRQLVSEQQRAAAQMERMEEDLKLQSAKQKEMARVDAMGAAKARQHALERHRRQEAALEWQLEFERLRDAEAEEARQNAHHAELEQEKRDVAIREKIAQSEAAALAKARAFAQKQQQRGEKIRQQNEEAAEEKWRRRLEDEAKAEANERERQRRIAHEKRKRQEAAERQAQLLAERLAAKQQKDEEDHAAMLARREAREAAMQKSMRRRQREQRKHRKAKEAEWNRKEEERGAFYKEREELRQKSIGKIEERMENKQKLLEHNKLKMDSENALKAETTVIKFEETRANIERMNRAWDFESDKMRMDQLVRNTKTDAMQRKQAKLNEKRRYEAAQFLLAQASMREDLAAKARARQTQMAAKAALLTAAAASGKNTDGAAPARLSPEQLRQTLGRLASPVRRRVGGGTPEPVLVGMGAKLAAERAAAAGGSAGKGGSPGTKARAGRDSPLPIWTWQVGANGSPQPHF
eukprot:SAG11_NODE_166_length_13763_cov_8.292722_10_plen_618_part_00